MNWIIELFFYGIGGDVSYAVAEWLIPLGVSAGSKAINYFSQRGERRRGRQQRDRFNRQRDEALEGWEEMIGTLDERADEIETDASVDDLYGDLIQLFGDQTTADTESAAGQFMRALMAGGGDVTGTGASAIQEIRGSGQRRISDIISQFTEMTDRRNLQNEARQDQLHGTAMGHRGNMFQALSGMATDAQGRVDRRSTADRQMLFDSLGMGLQTWGALQNQTPSPQQPGA